MTARMTLEFEKTKLYVSYFTKPMKYHLLCLSFFVQCSIFLVKLKNILFVNMISYLHIYIRRPIKIMKNYLIGLLKEYVLSKFSLFCFKFLTCLPGVSFILCIIKKKNSGVSQSLKNIF